METRTPDAPGIFGRLKRRRLRGIVTVFAAFWMVIGVPMLLLGTAIVPALSPAFIPYIGNTTFWISGVLAAVAVWVLYGRVPPTD